MVNSKIGIKMPEILLPRQDINKSDWAVVACDQYTSQRDYWEAVEEQVGDTPSTLHFIFPEVYLEDTNPEERIARITATMENYIHEGFLVPQPAGFIYVERETTHGSLRRGLMAALDLECYDYHLGAQTLIRATEGTVLDRLPPRIRIREGACLESPHIMVLIDDPEKTVIEPLTRQKTPDNCLYDFPLMMDGGHLRGYRVHDEVSVHRIVSALEKLADPAAFAEKYQAGPGHGVLLYAVGDGNHSLATAKACWENLKTSLSPAAQQEHPARFALVELVNVHDEGLSFEPIHRVLFHVEPQQVLQQMAHYFTQTGQGFVMENFTDCQAAAGRIKEMSRMSSGHIVPYVDEDKWGIIQIDRPLSNLAVGSLQSFLDDYLQENPGVVVDYIHGSDVTEALGQKPGNMGFMLPPMDKKDLFKTVILDGVLPRKTFSMGEAEEKRFYLECRRIMP